MGRAGVASWAKTGAARRAPERVGRVMAVDVSTGAVAWDRDEALLTVAGADDVVLWAAAPSRQPGAQTPGTEPWRSRRAR